MAYCLAICINVKVGNDSWLRDPAAYSGLQTTET